MSTRGRGSWLRAMLCAGAIVSVAYAAWSDTTKAEYLAALGPVKGTVDLGAGIASLEVPPGFQYLPPEGSKRLLTEGWGNPPEAADGVLGMIVPESPSPLDSLGWGVVIEYSDEGFVDDKDAESIDYDELMEKLKASTVERNTERAKSGYPPVTLIGWATPPRYDRAAHKMYWAREIAFGASTEHILNYDIRILGRRGVLQLKAVANMAQFADIEARAKGLLPYVNFKEGHRYTEYVHGSDKRAAYGVAGLVAGGIAAKAGAFKIFWVALLAMKKFLILGVVALGGILRRVFGGRKAETPAPPPAAPPGGV